MKRIALFAIGLFPLAASAGYPVSVQPASLNAPLPAAVQSALPAGPTPTSLLGSPSWGAPAACPAPCETTAPCAPATRPYFNLVTPRLPRPNGTCLDRLKQWICFQPGPGGPGCGLFPYQSPTRAYFRCAPTANCGAMGGCAPVAGCGAVPMAVTPLTADGYAAACRPRVAYQPLATATATPAPRVGPVARLFVADGWCAPPNVVPQEVVPTGGAVPALPTPTKWTARQPFTQQ